MQSTRPNCPALSSSGAVVVDCAQRSFFYQHAEGDRERDVVSFAGRDSTGGLVAAVLLEKDGVLSQLEFYSIDGHDPWFIPEVESLAPYQ